MVTICILFYFYFIKTKHSCIKKYINNLTLSYIKGARKIYRVILGFISQYFLIIVLVHFQNLQTGSLQLSRHAANQYWNKTKSITIIYLNEKMNTVLTLVLTKHI